MGLLDFLLGDDSSSNKGRIMTAAYSTQTDSAIMVVVTRSTGKTSALANTKVTDSNILTLMRVESGRVELKRG